MLNTGVCTDHDLHGLCTALLSLQNVLERDKDMQTMTKTIEEDDMWECDQER